MSKRAGESFAASAGAKQRPLHSHRLIARKISNENADMDYHAVLLPVYPAGGDSKREPCVGKILKDSTRRRLEHHAPDNSKQLEHQAPGDRLVEDLSSGQKVHLHPNTVGRKFDDPAKNFKLQSGEEHDF